MSQITAVLEPVVPTALTALTSKDQATVQALEELVRETHLLWDQEWVGFSWRNYTFEHMQRVRGLSRTLGSGEGADPKVLEFAATLHDVTKSYDGDILVGPDGKRVVDENGFWRNATLPPARQNKVTQLYDQLGLAGTVHSISGGKIADALLGEAGYPQDFRSRVDRAVQEHLIAGPNASIEGKVLNDADTIDANIGLPAFYRNIQISLHREDENYAKRGERFLDWLKENLPGYLDTYLKEKIPTWVEGKQRDFVGKLNTESARRLAQQRIDRLREVNQSLVSELESLQDALETGGLAVVRYFMENRSNPQMTEQLGLLEQRWSGAGQPPTAAQLLKEIRAEVTGDY
ncbi:MAG TPA: HD domain-containing protein [Chloroflexota bacterium]|nr:HD domain-containing protein [Chloroflexota bacterium]